MTTKYLYMIEFLIDDLFIISQDKCIPDEYLTCAKFSMSSKFFITVEYDNLNLCGNRGKCCVFSLNNDSLIYNDILTIRIYRQKTEKCKLLIAKAEIPMKDTFENLIKEFEKNNVEYFEFVKAKQKEAERFEKTIQTETDKKIESDSETEGEEGKEGEEEEEEKGDEEENKTKSESFEEKGNESTKTNDSINYSESETIKNDSKESVSEIRFSDDDDDVQDPHQILMTDQGTDNIIPATTVENRIVLLYGLQNKVVGNMVFKIRLTCFGPNVTSEFTLKVDDKCEDPCKEMDAFSEDECECDESEESVIE